MIASAAISIMHMIVRRSIRVRQLAPAGSWKIQSTIPRQLPPSIIGVSARSNLILARAVCHRRYEHFLHCNHQIRTAVTTCFATARNGFELLVVQFDDAALWVDSAIVHGLLLWKHHKPTAFSIPETVRPVTVLNRNKSRPGAKRRRAHRAE